MVLMLTTYGRCGEVNVEGVPGNHKIEYRLPVGISLFEADDL